MISGLDLDSLRELLELLKQFNVTSFSNGGLTLAFSGNEPYTSKGMVSSDPVKQDRVDPRELELKAAVPKDLQHLFAYSR